MVTKKSILIMISALFFVVHMLIWNMLLRIFISLNTARNGEPFTVQLSDLFHFELTTHMTYYVIGFVVYGVLISKILYELRSNFKDISESGNQQVNDFATIKDVKKQYKTVPEKEKQFLGLGGVPIQRDHNNILIDDTPVNSLIIGSTRSGKGQMFVLPMIDIYARALEKSSLVVNDPKGELVTMSKTMLEQCGYDVFMLNLVDPMRSASYNPLQLITDEYMRGDHEQAVLNCDILSSMLFDTTHVKDPFWNNCARCLTNALILAVIEDCTDNGEQEKITMYTVATMLVELGGKEVQVNSNTTRNALDMYFEMKPAGHVSKAQYAVSSFATGKTRSSIFTVAMEKLAIFLKPSIAKLTALNSLPMADVGFGKRPIAIFLITPDYDRSNHVLPALFINQLYTVLSKLASLSPTNQTKREVVFILDEFGNMPKINDFSNIITVCLGRNIKFNLFVQAYAQIEKLYGKDKSTIIANCGNQIFLLTNEYETADYFSKMIGEKWFKKISRSGKTIDFDKSKTETIDRRRIKTANELMRLKLGESIIVRSLKRTDLRGNKIIPLPIFNSIKDKTALKFQHTYLQNTFDVNTQLSELCVSSTHENIIVQHLLHVPNIEKMKQKNAQKNMKIGDVLNMYDQHFIADLMQIDADLIREKTIYFVKKDLEKRAENDQIEQQKIEKIKEILSNFELKKD